MAFDVIDDQQYHKAQFDLHPGVRNVKGPEDHQPNCKSRGQYHGGPGDDIPQPPGHQFELVSQDLLLR